MKSYSIIGLMSGTSMDGLDVSYCTFLLSPENQWTYKIHHAKTFQYSDEILQLLGRSKELSALELFLLDQQLGDYFAEKVNSFIKEFKIDKNAIDAIASHGHTVYHQPSNKITVQIGCGRTISNRTELNVINDFRKQDVLHGGQGAPLVPIGDKLLFSRESESFLNIGGFSNITMINNEVISAFDICPGNLPLNYVARKLGFDFDENGTIARSGTVDVELLSKLNSLSFYSHQGPKSLGTEWLDEEFMPLIDGSYDNKNLMATLVEHLSIQISRVLNTKSINSVFITGGGAKNSFLIERLNYYFKGKTHIPDQVLVDFKESIVFGLLGALYLENQPNCLSSVTGASEDVKGGTMYPLK